MKFTTIKMSVVSLLLISLSDVSADKIKDKRLEVMHTYTKALHTLQDGFLYNRENQIIDGAKQILKIAKEVRSHNMKDHLPPNQAYTFKFAQKITDRITVHSEAIIDATKRKKPLEAMDEFNYVIKQCTSCHLRVRGW